jgi:hypothetical protein
VALKFGVLASSQMTPEKPVMVVLSESLYWTWMSPALRVWWLKVW